MKKPWESKTVVINLMAIVAAFYPPVQDWIKLNPDFYGSILGVVNLGLRYVTKEKIG